VESVSSRRICIVSFDAPVELPMKIKGVYNTVAASVMTCPYSNGTQAVPTLWPWLGRDTILHRVLPRYDSVKVEEILYSDRLYFSIYFYLCNFNYNVFFVVYFLVFSVCEDSLGLSILVSIIHSHGNDYFQSYSVLQCLGFFVFLFF